MTNFWLASVVLAIATGEVTAASTPVLDQQQTVYGGGLSARTLPGYSVGQSFTAGITGTLTEIDMAFFNTIHGDGTLQVYQGEGITPHLLQTTHVPIESRPTGLSWNVYAVYIGVMQGQKYTFLLTPNPATVPDPYGVAVSSLEPPDLYPGGTEVQAFPGFVDLEQRFDLVFKTYVQVPEPSCAALLAVLPLLAHRPRPRAR